MKFILCSILRTANEGCQMSVPKQLAQMNKKSTNRFKVRTIFRLSIIIMIFIITHKLAEKHMKTLLDEIWNRLLKYLEK